MDATRSRKPVNKTLPPSHSVYSHNHMDEDMQARKLGYPTAHHWLNVVAGEAAFNVIGLERLAEYDQIFHPTRAITPQEAQLLTAVESPADWEWLATTELLEADGRTLTRAASDMLAAAVAVLDRL